MLIREANLGDMEFLFKLRNEPEVRAASWSFAQVECVKHVDWFHSILEDPNRMLYIMEDNGVSVGQVRYDGREDNAEVNISVSNLFYGNGYASTGLKESAKIFFEKFPLVDIIFAHIKPDNAASVRAFEKAGYEHRGIVQYIGNECVEMTLSRP